MPNLSPYMFMFHIRDKEEDNKFFSYVDSSETVESFIVIRDLEEDAVEVYDRKRGEINDLYKNVQFNSRYRWKMFDANLPYEFKRFGLLLRNLSYDNSFLIIKYTDNSAALYVPIRVSAFQQYQPFSLDNLNMNERFRIINLSTGEKPFQSLDRVVKYVSEMEKLKHLTIVYMMLPSLGMVYLEPFPVNKKSSKNLLNHIHENIVQLNNRLVDSDNHEFISYITMIEQDCRTPLLAFYNENLYSSTLEFYVTEETPVDYIISRNGVESMAEFFDYNILITQPFPHGPWFLWHSNTSERFAEETFEFLRGKFSKVREFGAFLEAVYKTNSVIPYGMLNDVITVNVEELFLE